MSQAYTSSCSGSLSVLLTLAILALFYNWTPSKNGVLAYDISGYEDNDALSVFRELVQDLATKDFMKSDGYLLRWLRYADFDVEKAHSAFEDSMNWRKENNIDSILEEGYSSIEERNKYSINGFDKEGRPVIFMPIGSYDFRKVALSGEQYKYKRGFIRILELAESYLQEIRDRTGFDNITQVVTVIDFAGFNLKQTACLNCLKILPGYFAILEPNYPLIFHKMFTINAPSISYSAIQLGKPFMSQGTKEGLKVFNYDKAKWSEALLEQISLENLPMKYGGIKPNFDKASYAIRNAAIMHLLGNENGVARSTRNYDNNNSYNAATTFANLSYQLNSSDVESTNTSPVTLLEDKNSILSKPDFKTSWFDQPFTPFDWIAPDNRLIESSSKISSFIKDSINDSEEKESLPHKGNHKQRHHHFKKISPSGKPKQITRPGNSTAVLNDSDASSAFAINLSNNKGYVLLLNLLFANFLIFVC